jgi:catechol 2,3-dioxygenase-like lactoylglutathione lyase family enzyme
VRLDHAGLSVADLDAAAAFWARAFGFQVEFEFSLPSGIRGVMLRGLEGRVELFERPGSAGGLRAQDPLSALATRGYGHVALSAPDIEAPFARAVEAGAVPKVTPRPSPEPGVRFAFLADPEGNLIELVERRS